jgi:16S rRNA (uracil1498-N3)-methyltransferase
MGNPSPPTERRVLRVPVDGLVAGERRLEGDAAHYVTRVHRLANGDAFIAFDPAARVEADATVLETGKRDVRCRFGEPRAARVLGLPGVTLAVCATKGDKLDEVMRAATALGASAVSVLESSRSVPELGGTATKRFARFRAIAVDAARQSGRGDVPELAGPAPLASALTELAALAATKLCLDPTATRSLGEALGARREGALVLLVGPEGGFTDEELAQAERAGFSRVVLGRLVLRAELAAVAALAAVVAQSSTQKPEIQR